MKVYCLFVLEPYQGSYLKAIYSNSEAAEKAQIALEAALRKDDYPGRDERHFDHAFIEEIKVDDEKAFCFECGKGPDWHSPKCSIETDD